MPKRGYRLLRRLDSRGMTLIEVMISTGLGGIIFLALMFLLTQTGLMSGQMTRNFSNIEGASEAVSFFNGVIPEITRIQSCNCRAPGAGFSSRASCIWSSGNPFFDPGVAGGSTGTLLSGEFEAYNGQQASMTSMASLLTNGISIPGQTCAASQSSMTASQMRGCKLAFQLNWTPPTAQSGATASKAGAVTLTMGTKSVSIGAATVDGARNLGVVKFACGFDSDSGGTAGSVFVLDMLVKSRANPVNDTSNLYYETWKPDPAPPPSCANNYCKGSVREIQLKYTLRNLVHRGVYFWRPESIRNCASVNTTVTKPSLCCSQAWDGTKCINCQPSGAAAASAAACCSGQTSGGNCL